MGPTSRHQVQCLVTVSTTMKLPCAVIRAKNQPLTKHQFFTRRNSSICRLRQLAGLAQGFGSLAKIQSFCATDVNFQAQQKCLSSQTQSSVLVEVHWMQAVLLNHFEKKQLQEQKRHCSIHLNVDGHECLGDTSVHKLLKLETCSIRSLAGKVPKCKLNVQLTRKQYFLQ